MNTKTQEALKMAIEALSQDEGWFEPEAAIKACKEALAQPAQEPVAWNEEEFNAIAYAYRTCPAHEIKMVSDRYQELVNYVLSITHTAPSWQGLSDDEIDDFMFESCDAENGYSITDLIKLVEQALKEKNAV